MGRLTDNKIVLIKRKTRLEELIARYNTIEQAKFYIEHMGSDFGDYLAEHKTYHDALAAAEVTISEYGRLQIVDRMYVPNFSFGKNDIVVALGQDGLVANTLKYLDGQQLLGVNPDRRRWDGALLPFSVEDIKLVLPEAAQSRRKISEVTMAKATLKDGQIICGVNDLFIGQRSHISSRYNIAHEGRRENQSSSGIIVSTGLGSSGWLKSILVGSSRIVNYFGDKSAAQGDIKVRWDSDILYFTVREPFPSRNTGCEIVFGQILPKKPLKVVSQMPENGVIFSDGMEQDFIEFNSGMEAVIDISEKKGRLVV